MANTICECGKFTLDVCPECKQEPLCASCKTKDGMCANCGVDEDEDDAEDFDDDDEVDEDDDDDDEDED